MPSAWIDQTFTGLLKYAWGMFIKKSKVYNSQQQQNQKQRWSESFVVDDDNTVGSVVAEWSRAPNLNADVSDQQSVGSSPSRGTCVLKHLTIYSSFGRDVKQLVPRVVSRT